MSDSGDGILVYPEEYEGQAKAMLANGLSMRGVSRSLGISRHEVQRIRDGRKRKAPPICPVTEENILLLTSKVEETGCMEWIRSKDRRGYGECSFRGVRRRVHRLSWCFSNGFDIDELSKEHHILHTCDNPPCINPLHLELGSHLENMKQMAARGRSNRKARYNAKLDWNEVREIRALHRKGVSSSKLAASFRISKPTVSQIVNNKTWQEVG